MTSKEMLGGDLLFTVRGFLSAEECQAYIRESEQQGFEEAMQAPGPGLEALKEIRNNARLLFDDADLAERWWGGIAPLIPARVAGRVAAGLNERFRFYRYDVGEKFQPHHDLPYERPNGDRSMLTLMVYLNEVCSGGETIFYGPSGTERLRVRPEVGKALVFPHAERHEGAVVTAGRKYVLRTDVMFSQGHRFVLE